MRVLEKAELRAVAGGGVIPGQDHQGPFPGSTWEWCPFTPDLGSTYVFEFGADNKKEIPPKDGESVGGWFSRVEKALNEIASKMPSSAKVKAEWKNTTKANGDKESSGSVSLEIK